MSEPVVVLDTRVVTGRGGGPDKTILNSPRFLSEDGYRMLCAYMHPPDDPGFDSIRQRAAGLNAPLISVPDRGPLDLHVARQLLDICRREHVQIWHGHDYKSNLIGLMLRPFWPMRLVTTVHGWVQLTSRTPLYYAIDHLALKKYERIICVSSDLHDSCRKLGIADKKCLLLQNGIDTERFQRNRSRQFAKEHLGLPADSLLVGAMGRLSAEKGFDLLIRAAARLPTHGHKFTLVIAGDGDQFEPLKQLISDLNCGDRVRLLGFVQDTLTLFEAMDVFVLSSIREGLPNVILEAMAMGVPVISTRVAGIPSLIQNDRNGILIEPGSVDQIVDALDRVIRDESRRRTFEDAGRSTVQNHFSFRERMQKLARIYDELLGSRPALTRTRESVNR